MTEALRPTPSRVWFIIALLVLALHLLVLLATQSLWKLTPAVPPRFEVSSLDTKQLDRVRAQWNQEKPIIDPGLQPASPTAPENARYSSDRNIRVEHEQRARAGDEGARQRAEDRTHQQTASDANEATKRSERTSLRQLGVPIKLDTPTKKQSQAAATGNPRIEGDGADQQLLDDSLAVGDGNLLNAQESKAYSFNARLREAILPLWRARIQNLVSPYGGELSGKLHAGDYLTQVEVRLSREGELLSVEIVQRSEIPEFDQAAEMPFRKLGRFPNPPSALLDERGEIRFTFAYQIRLDGRM